MQDDENTARPLRRRGPRVDAARNREKIVAAAQAAFAAKGADAPLEKIARQAGVGIGTLYRHFPTRNDLIIAALQRWMDEMAIYAEQLLRSDSPVEGLRSWLLATIGASQTGRNLAARGIVNELNKEHEFWRANDAKLAAGAALLARAQDQHLIREDFQISDVLRMTYGISITTQDAPPGAMPVEALLDVIMAGMKGCD